MSTNQYTNQNKKYCFERFSPDFSARVVPRFKYLVFINIIDMYVKS